METSPIVYVVDDDLSVQKSLARLLRSAGYDVALFASSEEYLSCNVVDRPSCLVLDIKMPGITGLELQERLTSMQRTIPIVFMTGYGKVPDSVRAMKSGAVDFLEKPYAEEELLAAVGQAIEKDLQSRREREELLAARKRLARLTKREREVFEQVVSGKLNKQIAYDLGITEKTIKVHRGRIMEKSGASSLADLVRLAEQLKSFITPRKEATAPEGDSR